MAVLIARLNNKNGPSAHTIQGLADDFAVLALEGFHVAHVAGDERCRAAVGKPRRINLLVHVAQPLGAVDYEHPSHLGSIEDVRRIDVLHVERGVLAHQDHVQISERSRHGFTPAKPALQITVDLKWGQFTHRDAISEVKVAHL